MIENVVVVFGSNPGISSPNFSFSMCLRKSELRFAGHLSTSAVCRSKSCFHNASTLCCCIVICSVWPSCTAWLGWNGLDETVLAALNWPSMVDLFLVYSA